MKINALIPTLSALLLAGALAPAHAASLITDGDFDSLPVGTAPDVDTPAGQWFWPADYQDLVEVKASQISIAPAPGGGTGNALRVSITSTENVDVNIHLPNMLTQPVTEASGEIVNASFDI